MRGALVYDNSLAPALLINLNITVVSFNIISIIIIEVMLEYFMLFYNTCKVALDS